MFGNIWTAYYRKYVGILNIYEGVSKNSNGQQLKEK